MDLKQRIYQSTIAKLRKRIDDNEGLIRKDPTSGRRSVVISGAPASYIRNAQSRTTSALDRLEKTPLVSPFISQPRGYLRETKNFLTQPASNEVPKSFLKSLGYGVGTVATYAGGAKMASQPLVQTAKNLIGGSAVGAGLGSAFAGAGNRLEGAKTGASSYLNMAPTLALTTPVIQGFSNSIASRFAGDSAGNIAGRTAAGIGNVVEGFELNRQIGRKPLESIPLDFAAGFAFGKPGVVNAKALNKTIDPDTLREVDGLRDMFNRTIKSKAKDIDANDRIAADRLAERYLAKEEIDSIVSKSRSKSEATYYRNLMDKISKKVGDYSSQYGGYKLGIVDEQATKQPTLKATETPEISTGKVMTKDEKYAFSINKPKLGLKGEEAKKLDDVVEQMKPLLEKNKGKPLTHQEIIEAGRSAKMLGDVMGREESKKFAESLQSSRNFLKSQTGKKGLTPEFLEQLEIVNSAASDAGRKLNAFATQAEDVTIKEKILKDLLSLKVDTDEMLAAGKNVDWDNAKEVTEFYRKFNPASLSDKLAEFRYTNMLSSPNTHIVNTFSNLLQTAIVAPVQKTIRGGLDFATSRLTGKEQEYFARQGVDYANGYWKALPEAWDKAMKVMSEDSGLTKPDINLIPTSTSKVHKVYTTPLRLLEASDQFFRTLVQGGEMKSLETQGITGAKAIKMAEESADYLTFRQAFDPEGKMGQGGVLKLWDKYNVQMNRLRNLPGGKWIVPFLQTPTNILKQGLEYSPAGIITMKGARDPIEQLSKSIIGTTVFMGAYSLADAGLLTWDAPTNSSERAEFYAAGLQPYSVKIGDKWVSYSKLGPLSYPIAMASALKWAQDNGGQEDVLATGGKAIGGTLGFFADQSYVRGIGDFIDAARGDDFKQSRALSNIPAQLMPYRAMMGWIARIVDPVYRKTSGGTITQQVEKSLISQVPELSKSIEAYQTPFGEDSQRQFPLFNAFSPLSVTQERGAEKDYYDARKSERDQNKQIDKHIKDIEEGKNPAVKIPTSDTNVEEQRKIAKKKQEAGMELTDEELLLTYDLDKLIGKNPTTAVAKARHEKDVFEKAVKIYRDEDISEESRSKLTEALGVNTDDLAYYDLASDTATIKAVAVQEAISNIQATSKDRGDMLRMLAEYRREVSGERVLSDSMISDLVSDEILSKEEGKILKQLQYDGKTKQVKLKTTGRGKSAKIKNIKFVPLDVKFNNVLTQSGAPQSLQAPQGRMKPQRIQVATPQVPQQPKFQVKFNL